MKRSSDDDFPLRKPLEMYDNNKYYPKVVLDECL